MQYTTCLQPWGGKEGGHISTWWIARGRGHGWDPQQARGVQPAGLERDRPVCGLALHQLPRAGVRAAVQQAVGVHRRSLAGILGDVGLARYAL